MTCNGDAAPLGNCQAVDIAGVTGISKWAAYVSDGDILSIDGVSVGSGGYVPRVRSNEYWPL